MRHFAGFLEVPRSFLGEETEVSTGGAYARRFGRVNRSGSKSFTRQRIGGVPIENPEHGMCGWHDGELFIWNGQWGNELGWFRVNDFRVLKVIWSGNPDFRVMPRSFYEASSGFNYFRTDGFRSEPPAPPRETVPSRYYRPVRHFSASSVMASPRHRW